MQLDNVTHLSDPDQDDVAYYASFEFYPFTETPNFSFYKGRLNGEGERHGEFCALRTVKAKPGQSQDWIDLINSCKKTHQLADLFNKTIGQPVIDCPIPLLTQLDRKSGLLMKCVRLFRSHEKRLKRDEWLCLEPLLRGPVQVFDSLACRPTMGTKNNNSTASKNNNSTASMNNNSTASKNNNSTASKNNNSTASKNSNSAATKNNNSQSPANHYEMAQAFSHFTWHVTRTLLVCDLQGNAQEHGQLTLINPSIHSLGREFGQKDRAAQGIQEFFQHHRCTNICSSWDLPRPDSRARKDHNIFLVSCPAGTDSSVVSDHHLTFDLIAGQGIKKCSTLF